MIKFKKTTLIITIFGFLNLLNFAIGQELIIPKQKPKVSTEKKEKIKLKSEIIPIKKPLPEQQETKDTKKVEIETKNPLSEDQFFSVVKKMVKQLKESVEVYSKAGRGELAEKEKSELEIIQVYLPEQLSEEKTIELVKEVISEISAESISDMGRVMSMVMQKSGGKVDGGIANRIAKELLQ